MMEVVILVFNIVPKDLETVSALSGHSVF